MKTRNALKLVTLSMSLSFRIVTYGDNQAGTFSKEVITVAKVFCDNQYGWALEEAIIRGNTNRVDKILRERGVADAINEVVAVGDGNRIAWDLRTMECGFNECDAFGKSRQRIRNGAGNVDVTPMGGYYLVSDKVFSLALRNLESGSSCYVLGTPLMIAARAQDPRMVLHLLNRGANPNVRILVKNYSKPPRMLSAENPIHARYRPFGQSRNVYEQKMGTWTCKRRYLYALLDCYMTFTKCGFGGYPTNRDLDKGKMKKADEVAKILIEHGARFSEDSDEDGRNVLWDVARVKSTYLLSEIRKRCVNIDINHEDEFRKTIVDYCEEELDYYSQVKCEFDTALSRDFLRALYGYGAKSKKDSDNSDAEVESTKPIKPAMETSVVQRPSPPIPQCDYAPVRQPTVVPSVQPKPDNSVEIAALQHRLLALRMQLEDARANRKLATVQGTGWVTASMHEQQIMQEIRDCERRIMELR